MLPDFWFQTLFFGLLFSNSMFPLFLQLLKKNWPYISSFQTILRNCCLSVILEFCLSVCSASTAYTNLCRGLKYLPKVRYSKVKYIILNDPIVARFLIFETLCFGRAKTLTYIWKKYHKNEQHLSLVEHIPSSNFHRMCV